MSKLKTYFSITELTIWTVSVVVIIGSYMVFGRSDSTALLASLIGVTSLTLNAKGNPYGQLLTVIFSVLYGIISYKASYYGEMITYLGMTAPMALFSMITWFKNTTDESSLEVKIRKMTVAETVMMILLAAATTIVFYYILKYFNTANLMLSTLSVTTSFLAVYLTAMRNSFYAICYGANDIVLIILWMLMIPYDNSALAMVLVFNAFLVNDIYGFINWNKIYRRQMQLEAES